MRPLSGRCKNGLLGRLLNAFCAFVVFYDHPLKTLLIYEYNPLGDRVE